MKLLSASWCTYCTPVKEFIKKHELFVEILDIDTPEGLAEAQKYGVRGIPALIKLDETVLADPKKIIAFLETIVE